MSLDQELEKRFPKAPDQLVENTKKAINNILDLSKEAYRLVINNNARVENLIEASDKLAKASQLIQDLYSKIQKYIATDPHIAYLVVILAKAQYIAQLAYDRLRSIAEKLTLNRTLPQQPPQQPQQNQQPIV